MARRIINRRDALVLGAVSSLALTLNGATALAETQDLEVTTLLKTMEDTWNNADMEGMFAIATPDIHWVNVVGMHWQGLADVKRAHEVFFKIMFHGVPLKLKDVESVKTLASGVKIIVVCWQLGAYVTPSGDRRPASLNRMSIIAVPESDGLKISHVANIEVNEGAAAFNPIKG